MGKVFEQTLLKDYTQLANKHMKRCATPAAARACGSDPGCRASSHLLGWLKKKTEDNERGRGGGDGGPFLLRASRGRVERCSPFGKPWGTSPEC